MKPALRVPSQSELRRRQHHAAAGNMRALREKMRRRILIVCLLVIAAWLSGEVPLPPPLSVWTRVLVNKAAAAAATAGLCLRGGVRRTLIAVLVIT